MKSYPEVKMATILYHFTHIDHLRRILADGLVCKSSIAFTISNISDNRIQDRRQRKLVTKIPANGNLHDYVPFYFNARSPMLYRISRNPENHGHTLQRDLIYLTTSAEKVSDSGLPFVFTDGHGTMAFTKYFSDLDDLKSLDWNVINGRYWSDTEDDNDRCRRRQAEFLVKGSLPWSLIDKIGVFDQAVKDRVLPILSGIANQPRIDVEREWYY